MPIVRAPLDYSIQSRTASTSKDSRSVNALFEGKKDKREVVKRPGLGLFNVSPALSAGQGQGLYSWNDYYISIVNNNIYTITGAGVSSLLGTITGNQKPISFTTVNNDTTLAFHNGSNLYTIAKGNPPTFVGGVGLSGVVSSVVISNPSTNGYYGVPTSCTIAVGATTVVTQTAHGLIAGQGVQFKGTLPTGMVVGTTYQVVTINSNSYSINTVIAGGGVGSAVVTSGTSSSVFCLASPTVTFSTSPGVTAKGTAKLYNNSVSEVVVTVYGSGYITPSTISFSSPPTGTAGYAVLNSARYTIGGNFNFITPGNFVTAGIVGLNLANLLSFSGGSGYLTPPTITFPTSPASGLPPAKGVATINSAGTITAITITDPGQYVITVQGGADWNFSVEALGAVVIGNPPNTVAQASVVMASGAVTGPFASGLAYLDNKCYIMTTVGDIYNSNTDDPTTWSLVSIRASSDPDAGVALIRHLNYLVAFGQWSTEFFYDASNPTGSPLGVNQSAKLELGCANGYSVSGTDQTVLWVGQSQSEGRSVFMMEGLSPTKVSTRYVDKYLNAASMKDLPSGASSVRSYIFKIAGHTLYLLTLIDLNITLVYDMDEKEWYQWTSQSGDTGVTNSGIETYFTPTAFDGDVEYAGSSIYLQDDQTGLIYKMKSDYVNDNGNNIYFRLVSPLADSGTNKRKFYTRLEVIGDYAPGFAYTRHSDNDYATWSSYRPINLTLARPVLYQNGAARRRAFELFISDNIAARFSYLEMELDVGETGE